MWRTVEDYLQTTRRCPEERRPLLRQYLQDHDIAEVLSDFHPRKPIALPELLGYGLQIDILDNDPSVRQYLESIGSDIPLDHTLLMRDKWGHLLLNSNPYSLDDHVRKDLEDGIIPFISSDKGIDCEYSAHSWYSDNAVSLTFSLQPSALPLLNADICNASDVDENLNPSVVVETATLNQTFLENKLSSPASVVRIGISPFSYTPMTVSMSADGEVIEFHAYCRSTALALADAFETAARRLREENRQD